MKKISLLLILMCSLLVVSSCNKNDDDNTDDPNTPSETKYDVVELTTKFGVMYIWLHDETPLHKANFLKLANEGFYDSTTFHRLDPGFLVQGGDPNSKDGDKTNDGKGGPGYTIPAEIVPALKHVAGSVGAYRDANPDKESNGSQFYIIQVESSKSTSLDGAYTVFGQVIKGLEQVTTMVSQPFDANKRPLTDIPMYVKVKKQTKAEIKADYNFDVPE